MASGESWARAGSRAAGLHDAIVVPSSPMLPPMRPPTTSTAAQSPEGNDGLIGLGGPADGPAASPRKTARDHGREYIVLSSTPEPARAAVQTSKYFEGSQNAAPRVPASSASEAEPAVRRRHDWTPPPADTVTVPGPSSSSPASEEWAPSDALLAGRREVFGNLQNSFGCTSGRGASLASAAAAKNPSFTKRKPIEAISMETAAAQPAGQASPPPPPPPKKTKAPSKKPRTLTELAVAAYVDRGTTLDAAAERERPAAAAKRQLDPAASEAAPAPDLRCRPGHPNSKLRKLKTTSAATAGAGAARKKAKAKKPKQPAARPVPLLSPKSARTESMHQDFVFGTSSQLAAEQVPAYEQPWDTTWASDILGGSSRPAEPAPDAASSPLALWRAATRDETGGLAFDHVVDLAGVVEWPEDPSPDAIEAAARAAGLPLQPEPEKGQTQHSPPRPDAGGKAAATSERPDFSLLTTAQLTQRVSSFGYKPMRGRAAMVALLNECWEAQHAPSAKPAPVAEKPLEAKARSPLSSLSRPAHVGKPKATQFVATTGVVASASRPSEPNVRGPSLSQAQARPHTTKRDTAREASLAVGGPVEHVVLEIEDSESDGRFSSPASPRSVVSDSETSLSGNGNEAGSPAGAGLTGAESELFRHISRAVVGAPQTDDPTKPSWHEKMLMYDTIILEDFTAWLNDEALVAAGFESPITPLEAKKWCEANSVCCTWRKNLQGKDRKL